MIYYNTMDIFFIALCSGSLSKSPPFFCTNPKAIVAWTYIYNYIYMHIYIYIYFLRRTINHGYLLTPDSFYCAVHCGVHKKRAARFPARALLGGSSKKVLVVVVHDPS